MSGNDQAEPDRTHLHRVASFVPNLLSFARIGMGLAFPWIPSDWRICVVVAAAASDFTDGAISRALHATSTTGRIIDPVADKIFAICVLVTLLIEGQLQWWHAVLVCARDLAVIAGVIWVCIRQGVAAARTMYPRWLGKLTTALQFAFILSVLALRSAHWAFLIPTALCSIAAGIDYLKRYRSG